MTKFDESIPKLPGYYWLKEGNENWKIVEVVDHGYDPHRGNYYVWACGWEVPLQPNSWEWGGRITRQ